MRLNDLTQEQIRGLLLQAKWNGTTVEEEFNMMYGKRLKYNTKELNGLCPDTVCHRYLDNKERDACIYHNKYVLNNINCCDGQTCAIGTCPNCKVRKVVDY